jgi:hypothetical protein
MIPGKKLAGSLALLAALGAAGCGSSSNSTSTSSANAPSASSSSSASNASTTSAPAVGALSQEAQSASKGDIPDNQVYLSFGNPQGGYSIKYPEGWTRSGTPTDITFADKNNRVRIVIGQGPAPTAASMTAELQKLKASTPTLTFESPSAITLTQGPAIKATYTTQSAPNQVTGKSVQLIVDRYEFVHGAKHATVDLGTAKGVDNVDAYRMMINGFKWQ